MGYIWKGTEPFKIKVQEGAEKAFEDFPGLTQQELDTVNDFYDHYLFYEKSGKGRKFWSSCCHEKGKYLDMLSQRTINNQTLDVLWGHHDLATACPLCGKTVTLKSKGTAGTCKNLKKYIPVVFLSTADEGATIYAQAYWTMKNFDHNWAAEPLYSVTLVYRFRRGEAVLWDRAFYENVWSKSVNGFLSEPFRSDGLFNHIERYQVIGLECLKDSFLRYIKFDGTKSPYEKGYSSLMRFLGLAAQFPENVEMLQKAGMTEVFDDWVYRRKKNSRNIRWGEKDPRKAFSLNGKELKEFLSTQHEMSVMTMYKSAKRQKAGISMEECQEIRNALGWSIEKELPKLVKTYGTTMKELFRYLKRQSTEERTFGMAFRAWKDYMTAAEALEMRIYREDVKFPKDLWTAHEEATKKNSRRLEKERRQRMKEQREEEQKRLEWEKKSYEERKEALELRYGYEADGLLIRIPESGEEIVAEGKSLQHCVGGYADRHIRGSVTILFLRKASAPDKPFLTVELNGEKLVQIHGYKNEGLYTDKGRCAPDPREVYKDFLNPWLAWIEKGSRRNKKGLPVLPAAVRKKEDKIA